MSGSSFGSSGQDGTPHLPKPGKRRITPIEGLRARSDYRENRERETGRVGHVMPGKNTIAFTLQAMFTAGTFKLFVGVWMLLLDHWSDFE